MFWYHEFIDDNLFHLFRKEKETLVKIGKMLKESSIFRRHRRIMLNIHITFLAWITEFIGFFVIFLGTFVLGHENNFVNFSLQTVTIFVYFNLLPCVFLMNTPEFKDFVSESPIYEKFLNVLSWQYKKDIECKENEDNNVEDPDHHE